MKRRSFVKSALTAAAVVPMAGASSAADASGKRQFIELRRWVIDSAETNRVVSNFAQRALLPALKRAGAGKTGFFYHLPDAKNYPEQSHDIYSVAGFDSLEQWLAVKAQVENDEEMHKAGAEYFGGDRKNPVYRRIESSLMIAFKGYPRIEAPRSSKDRIFELRRYESHNEKMAKLKIQMFNHGELDIFAKVGLDGVFYGEMLAGANMPNLTYMLAYDSLEERTSNFAALRIHPEWDTLKKVEKYKGTVSKVDAIFLKPTPFSEV